MALAKIIIDSPDPDIEETRTILTNHRFLYRGYLQIAALNLSRSTLNDLWLITWDPTESPRGLGGGLDKPKGFAPQGRAANGVAASQPVATRPLAIQQSGTWYVYGTYLPKNVTELYSTSGYIHTAYTYSPYGLVTASGNVTQPLQWSSEYADTDLGLVYYNYRHYNPLDGRWNARDLAGEKDDRNLYVFFSRNMLPSVDYVGLAGVKHFQYQVTYREENHGQSRVMADLEEVAKSASEYSKSHIYEISRGIQMIINSSSLIQGKQYRYFIRFDCICDDGCFFII